MPLNSQVCMHMHILAGRRNALLPAYRQLNFRYLYRLAMEVNWIKLRMAGTVTGMLVLAACGPKPPEQPSKPPEVGVITVSPQAVSTTTELPGRTNAFLVAQVRARVDGIVLRRGFTEGDDVKEGQRLYKIDPAPTRAVRETRF